MTETPQAAPMDVTGENTPDQAPLTAGQLLHAARLAAGVQLGMLSVTLKVPIKQLEALEADQLDPAKGTVFFRGLAAAVCRQLQTDPAPILALLPHGPGHLLPQRTVEGTGSPLKSGRTHRVSSPISRSPVFWGGLTMTALIAVLLWLPVPSQWLWPEKVKDWVASLSQVMGAAEPETVASGPATAEASEFPGGKPVAEVVALPMAVTMTDAASAPVVAASAAVPLDMANTPVTPPTPPKPLPALSPARVPDVAAAPLPAASQSGLSAAAVKPSAPLVFSASVDSWIELRNGPNNVVWSGLLKAGQSREVQSPLPVSVVVGRAQGVSVTLRGKPFDLTPHTQVTVARFELKE